MIIRNATIDDLHQIVNIERTCFPAAEAAPEKSMRERIETFSDGFLVAVIESKLVGFINGAVNNSRTIKDEHFADMTHHLDDGDVIAVYGLDVLPEYQNNGYAAELMNAFIDYARTGKRSYVILTCKEHLIHYYERFGFKNDGLSDSEHGGAKWYDMTLTL